MKLALPAVTRLNQALKTLPGVHKDTAGAKFAKRDDTAAESFRLLALNTRILMPVDSNSAVVVMSAFPRDGRSFVAENLALALAEESHVVLVEQIGEQMALRDRLDARQNGSDPAVPVALKNSLLSTKHQGIFLHPTARQAASSLSVTMSAATDAGMFTVVDSPPALTSSSAFLLAREVGQVIYVVTRKVQDIDVHRQIREQLDRLGVEILGLVLNEC